MPDSSPLSDAAARLVQQLPECAPLVAATGAWSLYAADCLVRHLLEEGWAGALALGWSVDRGDLVVEAGIGYLHLGPMVTEWRPVLPRSPLSPTPAAITAPVPLVLARRATCRECPRFDGHCTIAGCGCAGQGQPEALLSRCPLGRWPSPRASISAQEP
jgi:hypothetical protein